MRQLMDEGVAILSGSTGFWPLDPLGDLQMLFTQNMHKHLAAVASNSQLQSAIRAARGAHDGIQNMHAINQILFDEAIYNIYTHHQYFYAAAKLQERVLRQSPIGVTVPYPWQVFR
ncbi:MAG: hypothetical protein HC902_07690 [Calothrix sp. SM1_5_4]|nr:hypothetical protein [Calothrix sp. SM1_5_4]